MILTEEQKKGQEVFFTIIKEAWLNDNFKKALLENPEKALETFFGRKTPVGKKIKVCDQSDPNFLYINIPVKPDSFYAENTNSNTIKQKSTLNDYETIFTSLKNVD